MPDESADGLEFTSNAMLSSDVAAEVVIDDEGYVQLPKPPDLGSLIPPDTAVPAPDTGQQGLLTDSHLEAADVCVETVTSDTTVNFQLCCSCIY